jgi:diaminopropionate ammonia-lyase
MSRASGGGVMRRGYSSWRWGADFEVISGASVRVLSQRNPVESTISRTRHWHNEQVISSQQCPEDVREVLSGHGCVRAFETIGAWPDYRPTELRCLGALSSELGLSALHYKDESSRFGLSSFKALGGAYAVQSVLRKALQESTGLEVGMIDIDRMRYPEACAPITVVTATDGNHGRSVAWGAQRFGCQCVVYMHEHVSQGRQEAVEVFGARVQRVKGNYDDSVHAAARDARLNGWITVSDTSWPGYIDVPRLVMSGYTVMTSEAMAQWPHEEPPTHVFIQGGCGGLAAAVCIDMWSRYGSERPRFIVVEPESAACLHASACAGEATAVDITTETVMAGLSCGEVSLLTWPVLSAAVDDFLTITDERVGPLMRRLDREESIVAGESAVAGLAALFEAAEDDRLWKALGLTRRSRVLLLGTEGATDPELYRRLVT